MQEVEREPINEITDIRNVHDMLIYTLKQTIQRLKTLTSEDLHAVHFDKLLHDIGQLEMIEPSAKICDINVGKTLADWIGFNGV